MANHVVACGKMNHFNSEIQQDKGSDKEWSNILIEEDRNIDSVITKSFSFKSITPLIVTKLKTSSSTGSKSKVIPINMFKVLFPRTSLAELAKKKVVLQTYSNSGVPQLGVCRVRITHKDKQNPCRFFVVSGGGTVLRHARC